MDENYWKDAYQDTWDESSKREKRLKVYLERLTGMKCEESGLGAGSSQYISGSAARNGYQKGDSPKYFYENQVLNDTLANAVNKLTTEEAIKVNDILTKLRMEKYFQSVDKNPIQNVNNINGWYNRTKSYYSNPQEFEQLYRHRVDDYIQNKYPQFYNGQ